jgi:predicted RNA binding protein YcfA (HicA-like mRNA interferase family)
MSKAGLRSKEEREMIVWAKTQGWVVVGRNGSNHVELQHRGTGELTRIPSKFGGKHIMRAVKGQLRRQGKEA